MKSKLLSLLRVASAAFFFASPVLAQNTGTVSNHAVPIGKGPGVTGFGSAAPGTAGFPLLSNGASSDPTFSPGGISANVLNTQTANYTIANTDCGKTVQAGTGSTGLFTVTLPSVAGFASTCVVTVVNGDTGRGKTLSGFPSAIPTTLWPKQATQVAIINGAWAVTINPGKWRPTSAVVFNISTTGSDSGDCLGTGASACATGQFAMNLVCANLDLSLLNINTVPSLTIQFADGAYTQNLAQFCDPSPSPWISSMQAGWLKIAGNTNLTGVTLACGAAPCVSPVHSTAGWWIEGLSMTGTAGSFNIDAGSHIYIGTNKFGTTGAGSYDLACAYGSLCEFEANFTITGSKNQFIVASQSGSRVIFKPITVTLTASTYSTFYTANTNATISAGSATYSGAATVTVGSGCWVVNTGGGLDTGGNLAPVTTACGGQTSNSVNPGWAQ